MEKMVDREGRATRLVACGAIAADRQIPDFGPALRRRLEGIRHPERRSASVSAWRLLARLVRDQGIPELPEVAFGERGKPYFRNCPLHFSISHSGLLCAVSLAEVPTGVDVERARPNYASALVERTLSDAERAAYDGDFPRLWCRKESVAKLTGRGMGAHPARIDTLDPGICFAECAPIDALGAEYRLAAAFLGAPGEVRILMDQEEKRHER